MRTAIVFFVLVTAASVTFAQQDLSAHDILNGRVLTSSVSVQPKSERPLPYRIPGKRASQYTAEDWGRLIDSTWGPGQSGFDQRQVFDTFWSVIDQYWACFPNLPTNIWDSLQNVYRPQIPDSGLSRGRFYGLISRMRLDIRELHTRFIDWRVDTTYGWFNWTPPNTFHYRPGVPILITGTYQPDIFGAAVTPLPDSTNLVYRAAPGNPLGLVPGDLVLGYEGVPWKRLYRQLLDARLPVSIFNSWSGTTPESQTHFYLMAVGHNWGLFDTIDIVKYSSGDTLHLPTALLDTTIQTVWESDQVPIAGVPMPEAPAVTGYEAVSWGVVQGTNIGYIYVWDWANDYTRDQFESAVVELIQIRRVEGLVIDFRMNMGGGTSHANKGFNKLFNFDYTANFLFADRTDPNNHMGFTFSPPTTWRDGDGGFQPAPKPYDRPIAVLIGPGCFSSGDHNASRIRFHPMVRLFGKPTDGAFVTGPTRSTNFGDRWRYYFYTRTVYSNVPGEGFLIHKGVQPDEEVWLTRASVANGEDDVVKRALAWMDSLSYAHNVMVSRDTVRNPADSIRITAKVENPGNHALVVSAIVTTAQGAVVDSVVLTNAPGDSVWGKFIRIPSVNGRYNVSVRTTDVTAGTYRRLPNAAWFTVMFTGVGVSISSGWNLISNPVTNPIPGDSVRQLYPTSMNPYVFEFIGGYEQKYRLQNGKGYWGKFPAATTNTITGAARTRDSMSVASGWNIVGTISNTVDTNTIVSVPSGLRASSWFGYSAGYDAVTQIVPGKGYWVKSNAAGKFVMANPLSGPAKVQASDAGMEDQLNLLTITDSRGGSQTLYFGADASKSIPVTMYQMPPLPPVGAFDARFETSEGGSLVQTHGEESAEFTVAIQSDAYPVTVTWNVKDASYELTAGAGSVQTMRGEGTMKISNSEVDRLFLKLTGNGQIPKEYALQQNYPNPFNPSTKIKYQLPIQSHVTLKVYNLLGQEVATLVDRVEEPGYKSEQWDASSWASGMYFYRISTTDFVQTRKLLLLK